MSTVPFYLFHFVMIIDLHVFNELTRAALLSIQYTFLATLISETRNRVFVFSNVKVERSVNLYIKIYSILLIKHARVINSFFIGYLFLKKESAV